MSEKSKAITDGIVEAATARAGVVLAELVALGAVVPGTEKAVGATLRMLYVDGAAKAMELLEPLVPR